MIPKEAFEAAMATVREDLKEGPLHWSPRRIATRTLNAAAPFLRAQALEDAADVIDQDAYEDLDPFYADWLRARAATESRQPLSPAAVTHSSRNSTHSPGSSPPPRRSGNASNGTSKQAVPGKDANAPAAAPPPTNPPCQPSPTGPPTPTPDPYPNPSTAARLDSKQPLGKPPHTAGKRLHDVHCPACGRYAKEAPDGLPDCTRHGIQETAF